MLKPICVPCRRFFRPKTNGFAFIEGMPTGGGPDDAPAQPGLREPHRWVPYKAWNGDKWWCPDCKAEIIVGVISQHPMAEHYEDDFASIVRRTGADQFQVNDC